MSKYHWSIDDILIKQALIKKKLNKETDFYKAELLEHDYNLITEYLKELDEENAVYQTEKLLDSYNFFKEELNNIDFLWDDFNLFYNKTKGVSYEFELKKTSINSDDILTLTHDFYKKKLNSYFFNHFMKNFSKRRDHIIFKNNSDDYAFNGKTIPLPSLGEAYIEIFRNHTLEDVLTTIHEYSHANSILINPHHLIEQKTSFTEIDSIFMELIGADFLNKELNTQKGSMLHVNTLNEYSILGEMYVKLINLIKVEKYAQNGYTNNKILKQTANNNLNMKPQLVEDLLQNADMFSSIYVTSYLFAIELYNIYKEDKEKALYLLKKIILLDKSNEKEYYDGIIDLGVIPNASSSKYIKECNNTVMKLVKKKSR